jgi:hypothetical protein
MVRLGAPVNTPDLNAAWVRQAQLDADRGVIECRVCKAKHGIGDTITLWVNGTLLFAVCARCRGAHDIVMRPTERGIEIAARARSPLLVGRR